MGGTIVSAFLEIANSYANPGMPTHPKGSLQLSKFYGRSSETVIKYICSCCKPAV